MRGDGMNGSRSTEVKVGVGVILAAIILIFGVIWIGDVRFSRKWQVYTVYFDEVGGLSEGDPVTIAGLEMGEVEAISLEEGRVKTDLLIEQGVVLRSDLSVEIQSIGLMGEKYIHILPGTTGEVLSPGSMIEGDYKAGLPEVVADVGDLMEEAKSAAEALNRLVSGVEGNYNLGENLSKLSEVSNEILAILRENRADIRSASRNMNAAAGDLKGVVGGKRQEIEAGIESFSRAAARLDSLTVKMQDLVVSVEAGEGTLGMLIKEKKLHQDAEEALRSLNELLLDIKAHPERYVKIEIF
jgi:phospholipid/cholesterol/gamma-HCH transport system substrate-binding protein